MSPQWEKRTPEQMDQSAIDAQNDLPNFIGEEKMTASEAFSKVKEWWSKWYLLAGHKRLGRIIKDKDGI